MAEYINRAELIENLNKFATEHYNALINQIITKQPTADVQEVRHGKWISNNLGGYKWAYYCSECGWIDDYPFNDRHKYCSHCGAKMDREE